MQKCVTIAINYVDYKDSFKAKNQRRAMQILSRLSTPNCNLMSVNFPSDKVDLPPNFRVFKSLKGDSQNDIGNWRKMPYIKEIMDHSSKLGCSIFGYMNSDILVTKDFFKMFRSNADAYICSRIDIEPLSINDFINGKIKVCEKHYVKGIHDGVDAFFFSKKWWKKNSKLFHDGLIMGEPFWDWYYRDIIHRNADKYIELHNVYHVWHDVIWRNESPGGSRNEAIYRHYRSTVKK